MTSLIVIILLSLVVVILVGCVLVLLLWQRHRQVVLGGLAAFIVLGLFLVLILLLRPGAGVGGVTTVPQPSAPLSVSFLASPSTVSAGQCANLVWDVAGQADSIKLDQQVVGAAGQMQVCPQQSETHRLEARGSDGSIVTRQVSLLVQSAAPTGVQPAATAANPPTSAPAATIMPTQPPAPCAGAPVIQSFNANPATISAGVASVLSWGPVSNATSAVIDQGIGGVAAPGSITLKPGQTTTYTLTATGCGGTVTKQVTITVGKFLPPPTLGTLQVQDLAVTKVGPVSLTGANKVYVDIKNTGNVDIDANVHVVCTALGRVRGNPTQVVPTASDETLHITLSKGGTGFFNPSLIIDATAYSYDFVQCVVGLTGDPTPDDNQNGFNVP